jgi:hypothetical protein
VAGAVVAWTAVVALVFAAAGSRAVRRTAKTSAPRRATVVDVVLERAAAEGPVLWLNIAAGSRRCLMRLRISEQNVTVETDLTSPPSLRRYDPPDPVASLALRVLWAAAEDERSAHAGANQLLALVANDIQSLSWHGFTVPPSNRRGGSSTN